MSEGNQPPVKLVGSANAGGSEYITEVTFAGSMSKFFGFFREYGSRDEYSYFNTRGMDHQHRPPKWMEHKNVAVDGTPLTNAELRDPRLWEMKYEKELAIGNAIQIDKSRGRFEYFHSLYGTIVDGLRIAGIAKERERDPSVIRAKVAAMLSDEELDREVEKSSSQFRRSSKASAAWEALVVSIDTNRPMAKVAQEYRPKVDFYGIDPFLDSAPSLMWFCCKIGMAIGMMQGTIKTFHVVNADAQFLRASGLGILSVLNVAVFAGVVKWGGNCALFAGAFCVGDRLAKFAKKQAYPAHDANQRSMLNYATGLSFSMALIGTLPWWMLNDVRFAVRLATSGMFIGACLGAFVGSAMDRLVALNLGRLNATNRDLRRYEALMKRESMWLASEDKKVQNNNSSLLF